MLKNLHPRTLVYVPFDVNYATGLIETEIGDGDDERLTSVSLRLPYSVALTVSCNRSLARKVLEEMARGEGLRSDSDDERTPIYVLH